VGSHAEATAQCAYDALLRLVREVDGAPDP